MGGECTLIDSVILKQCLNGWAVNSQNHLSSLGNQNKMGIALDTPTGPLKRQLQLKQLHLVL